MFRGHSIIGTGRGRLEGNQRVPEAGWGQAINFSLKVQSCVVWKQELSEVGKGDLQAWGGWDSGQLRGAEGRDGDLHQCGDQGSGAEHRLRQRWLGDWMCPAEPGSPVGGLSGENVLYFEMCES